MRGTFLGRVVAIAGFLAAAAGCGGYSSKGKNYDNAPPQLLIGASLLGSSETTVVSPAARGSAGVEVKNDGTLSFAVTGEASWVASVTEVAIRRGPVGANGPIEVDLLAASSGFDGTTRTAEGTLNVGAALGAEMINYPDYFYVDVHTTGAPTGLVRGQMFAAPVTEIHAALSGAEELTVIDTNSRGAATLSIGIDRKVHYVVATKTPAVNTITFSLLERGAAGVNGPVELDLGSASGTASVAEGTITGDVVAPLSLLTRLAQDLSSFHMNLHAIGAPSGICRGQMTNAAVGLWATLAGSSEVPVVDANARGGATLELTSFSIGRAIHAVPPAQDVTLVNGAFIQQGVAGANGPTLIDLRAGADFTVSGPTGTAEGEIVLNQALYARMLANPAAFYANIMTTGPGAGGLARGQLSRSAATFTATMLGTLEVPPPVPSTGAASCKLLLTDVHAASFDLNVTVPAVGTITDAHIHQGATGVNGPIVISLLTGTGVQTAGTHITGNDTFTGRTAAMLLAAPELFYCNAHTLLAPNGVARGQLARVPDTAPPTGLTYTTPVVYVTNTTITPNSPTSGGGAVASYSILPALTAGLSINPTTGIISGTPTAFAPLTVYTVSASNAAGTAIANVTITVNVAAPTGLTYATQNPSYVVNSLITPNTPSNTGGAITGYSGSLPAGLSVNPSTGVITGTPTVIAASTPYTITGVNGTPPNALSTLNITILSSLTVPVISYSAPPTLQTGYTMTPLTPTNTGGAAASYAAPSLPAGLSINTSTGVITGTPTATSAATNYAVTATNATGPSAPVNVNFTVTLGPPSNFSYNPSSNYGYQTPNGFQTMNPQNLTSGGGVTYSISPALPAGITLNTSTGVISGVPTATSAGTTYTVTATNGAGSGTASIYILIY